MQRLRNFFVSKFISGYRPTQNDWRDLFDSTFNFLSDKIGVSNLAQDIIDLINSKANSSELADIISNNNAVTFQFPTQTLSISDIGKLVMNENGYAVVTNKRPGSTAQLGIWEITLNEIPVPPTPFEALVDFNNLVDGVDITPIHRTSSGSSLVKTYYARINPSSPEDFQLVPNDGLANASAFCDIFTHPDLEAIKNNDGTVTFKAITECYGYYNGACINTSYNNNILPVTIVNMGENNFLDLLGNNYAVFEQSNTVNPLYFSNIVINEGYTPPNLGTIICGYRWCNTIEEYVQNIYYSMFYINGWENNFDISIMKSNVSGDTIRIEQKYYEYMNILCSSNLFSISTVQVPMQGIVSIVDKPVLGVLSMVEGGVAKINSTNIFEAKYEGANPIVFNPELNSSYIERLCVAGNNGSVIHIYDIPESGAEQSINAGVLFALKEVNVGEIGLFKLATHIYQ